MNRRTFLIRTSLMIAAFSCFSFPLNSFSQEETKDAPTPPDILPFLQNPQPKSMTVCFISSKATNVEIGCATDPKAKPKLVKANGLKIPETNHTIWKVQLKNLTPGTTYYYDVRYKSEGKEEKSETYSFTTPDPNKKSAKAIVFNDIHNNDKTLETLMTQVKPDDYEISLLLGDMWNDPSTKDNAYQVFKTMSDFVRILDASNKPMIFARGNHETRGSFAAFLSYLFELPLNDPKKEFAKQNAYQDLSYGPLWYICPDAGEDGKREETFKPYRLRQLPWLQTTLKNSSHKKAPWRILALHIPLYNPAGWDQQDALKEWSPALDTANIDAMIAGHDHSPRFIQKNTPFKRGKETEERTAPYPVLIGGGPTNGTIMFVEATPEKLTIRMNDMNGKELHKIEESK